MDSNWTKCWISTGDKSALKRIYRNLMPGWRLDYHRCKGEVYEGTRTWQELFGRSQNAHTLQNLKCYVDLWGNSNRGVTCAKWESSQWNLDLCPPSFLSWCQIHYLQQRQEGEGESHFPQQRRTHSDAMAAARCPGQGRTFLGRCYVTKFVVNALTVINE